MFLINYYDFFKDVEKKVECTKFSIKYGQRFIYSLRVQFNEALDCIPLLLMQEAMDANLSRKPVEIAHRIVQFHALTCKIEKVRQSIFQLPSPPYFCKKIRNHILPILKNRVNQLTHEIGGRGRLPFSVGVDRDHYYQTIKEDLKVENSEADDNVNSESEREYFHLLGNSFDNKDLKEIDISSYEGNFEIHSLISWSHVLSVFIQQGDESEKQIGEFLLKMLEQTAPFALKTTFAHCLPCIKNPRDFLQELLYYKDLTKAHQFPFGHIQSEFNQKYRLGYECKIPASVIINEIAWDMLEAIHHMKQGESRIFFMGSRDHCLSIQISCLHLNSYTQIEQYEYKIFNSGKGALEFHLSKGRKNSEKVQPFIIQGLARNAFSYSFISQLINLSLQEYDVGRFYALHIQFLLVQSGGRRELNSEEWYNRQKYSTCSYFALEIFLHSYLNEKQIQHLEMIKAQVATHKQKKVVSLLEKRGESSDFQQRSHEFKVLPSNSQKLKESQVLLELGEQYLEQISKDFSKRLS